MVDSYYPPQQNSGQPVPPQAPYYPPQPNTGQPVPQQTPLYNSQEQPVAQPPVSSGVGQPTPYVAGKSETQVLYPQVPEGPVSFENQQIAEREVTAEITKKVEVPKYIPQQPQNEQQNPIQSIAPQNSPVKQPAKIVDKTEEITQLHNLKNVKDSITRLADEEEENFIQEVESAHGNK